MVRERGEALAVLALVAFVLVFSTIGAVFIAFAARAATRRLGLEPWSVLVWFGLAEEQPIRVVRH
ncbi:MAG TPA: hypothetical protein VF066_07395 [Thermoleophilaceae bacterium]